jgi:hypothetical protein
MLDRARTTARLLLPACAVLATALSPAASGACAVAQVDVYDRTARHTLETHRHRGRDYIVGQPGNEYAVRIRNCTDGRVLAVVSVDGVNVVTGETAAPDQAGYVVEPGDYVNIQGWRKDLDRTAAFYFSDPSDAYATRTGRPDDLGVIGVALFRERRQRWFQPDDYAATPRAEAGTAAREADLSRERSAAAPAMEPLLGTGHGRREYSPVEQVEFERASRRPDQRVVIRYDRLERLVAMGVLPPARRWHEPDPFPGAVGFVPDP